MTTTRRRPPRRPATDGQRMVGIIGMIAVTVLALGLLLAVQAPKGHTVDSEGIETMDAIHSGTTREVRLPTATADIRMGGTVDEVERRLVDLPTSLDPGDGPDDPVRAPDGEVLLPVTWGVDPAPVSDEDTSTRAEEDTTEVGMRLVIADATTQLVDDVQVQTLIEDAEETRLLPVDEGTDVSDITVEVTYDGLTQTLTPEDGTVDSGAAAPLYDEDIPILDTTCDDCRMTTADDSAWRHSRDRGEVTPESVTLRPYREGLGWADEDTTWATVDVQIGDAASFYDRDGERRGQKSTPKTAATLDGIAAEDITWIDRSMTSKARLTFPIDADHTPRKLTITQKHSLEGSESATVTTREQITVRDRD